LTQIGGHLTLKMLQHILLALSAVFLPLWFVYVVLIVKERLQRRRRGNENSRHG